MKKLALSAILGASLMITSSAFALTSMSADNMKAATGQAGVSIAIHDVVIESFTGETRYTDTDGNNPYDAAPAVGGASVVISDKHTLKAYKPLANGLNYLGAFAAEVNGLVGAGTLTTAGVLGTIAQSSALTIDVGTCTVLSLSAETNANNNLLTDAATLTAALTTNAVAGVVIGLPTLMISTTADSYNVGIARTGATNDGANFIRVEKGASVMAILGGEIEIAPH